MYMRDNGLGFWTELIKMGSSVLTSAAPLIATYAASRNRSSEQSFIQTSPPADIPERSAAITRRAQRRAPRTDTLIRGVPNIAIYGGVALIAVALIMRKN